MCGRYVLSDPRRALEEFCERIPELETPRRYNVAPSQEVLCVRREEGDRRPALLRWGLIPFWADDEEIGYRMINARAETAPEKPAFRAAFRKRRCLVLADGFYEWRKNDGRKQPYVFYRPDGEPFAFAGLWERWEPDGEGDAVESCAILTTEPSDDVGPIHDRMPVIVTADAADRWLDLEADPASLLGPFPGTLRRHPVTTYVNSPQNEGRRCVQPRSSAPAEGAGEGSSGSGAAADR